MFQYEYLNPVSGSITLTYSGDDFKVTKSPSMLPSLSGGEAEPQKSTSGTLIHGKSSGWIILHNTAHGWGRAIAFSNPDVGNYKIKGKMFPGKPTQADADKLWDIVNKVHTHPPGWLRAVSPLVSVHLSP